MDQRCIEFRTFSDEAAFTLPAFKRIPQSSELIVRVACVRGKVVPLLFLGVLKIVLPQHLIYYALVYSQLIHQDIFS